MYIVVLVLQYSNQLTFFKVLLQLPETLQRFLRDERKRMRPVADWEGGPASTLRHVDIRVDGRRWRWRRRGAEGRLGTEHRNEKMKTNVNIMKNKTNYWRERPRCLPSHADALPTKRPNRRRQLRAVILGAEKRWSGARRGRETIK